MAGVREDMAALMGEGKGEHTIRSHPPKDVPGPRSLPQRRDH